MYSSGWLTALMFATLVAGLAFGLIQLLAFMNRRSNRLAAEHALTGSGSRTDSGALPDLAAIGAVALLAMGMLAFAYSGRSYDKQTPAPGAASTPASATDSMSDQAKPRANPADTSPPPGSSMPTAPATTQPNPN